MSLIEARPEGYHRSIRWVQPDRITVDQQTLDASFVLAPDAIVEQWPPSTFDAIDDTAIEQLLALGPELVLLGTGSRQRFLAPRLQAILLKRGVGVESMDNAAAARTYNLLAQESRRVVAAFVLPG